VKCIKSEKQTKFELVLEDETQKYVSGSDNMTENVTAEFNNGKVLAKAFSYSASYVPKTH